MLKKLSQQIGVEIIYTHVHMRMCVKKGKKCKPLTSQPVTHC